MAANKSENKVYVNKVLGQSPAMGMIDPKVNMVTDQGKIRALDSGNYTVHVGTGTVHTIFYPHQLHISLNTATGTWSYPSGDGSVEFGHSGVWPQGVPKGSGTGFTFLGQDGVPVNFYR